MTKLVSLKLNGFMDTFIQERLKKCVSRTSNKGQIGGALIDYRSRWTNNKEGNFLLFWNKKKNIDSEAVVASKIFLIYLAFPKFPHS